jgi:hypothetical protein
MFFIKIQSKLLVKIFLFKYIYMNSLRKKILVTVIEGSEEIETTTIANILTRADNEVKLCKVNINNDEKDNLIVKLARGMKIVNHLIILDR